MKKNIRVSEPSPEMQEKIRRARCAIVNQKMRMVKCPYCGHNAIAVFEDSRGHIQAKCKACGRETVFDVINMRRLYLRLHRREGDNKFKSIFYSCAVEPLIGESS